MSGLTFPSLVNFKSVCLFIHNMFYPLRSALPKIAKGAVTEFEKLYYFFLFSGLFKKEFGFS